MMVKKGLEFVSFQVNSRLFALGHFSSSYLSQRIVVSRVKIIVHLFWAPLILAVLGGVPYKFCSDVYQVLLTAF